MRLFSSLHPQLSVIPLSKHPTYLAFAELGKAIKTIFLCRYLHSEALRREIQEGLNVIETWNGTNSFILYGKGVEIATNDLENQGAHYAGASPAADLPCPRSCLTEKITT